MVTSFGVSHYIIFQGCACLSVFHLKPLKEFHNIFAYYVLEYNFDKILRKKTISFHFIKWRLEYICEKQCNVPLD
jgi:hypothetical protein